VYSLDRPFLLIPSFQPTSGSALGFCPTLFFLIFRTAAVAGLHSLFTPLLSYPPGNILCFPFPSHVSCGPSCVFSFTGAGPLVAVPVFLPPLDTLCLRRNPVVLHPAALSDSGPPHRDPSLAPLFPSPAVFAGTSCSLGSFVQVPPGWRFCLPCFFDRPPSLVSPLDTLGILWLPRIMVPNKTLGTPRVRNGSPSACPTLNTHCSDSLLPSACPLQFWLTIASSAFPWSFFLPTGFFFSILNVSPRHTPQLTLLPFALQWPLICIDLLTLFPLQVACFQFPLPLHPPTAEG